MIHKIEKLIYSVEKKKRKSNEIGWNHTFRAKLTRKVIPLTAWWTIFQVTWMPRSIHIRAYIRVGIDIIGISFHAENTIWPRYVANKKYRNPLFCFSSVIRKRDRKVGTTNWEEKHSIMRARRGEKCEKCSNNRLSMAKLFNMPFVQVSCDKRGFEFSGYWSFMVLLQK